MCTQYVIPKHLCRTILKQRCAASCSPLRPRITSNATLTFLPSLASKQFKSLHCKVTKVIGKMTLCLKVRGPSGQISLMVSPDQSWKNFKLLVSEQLELKVSFDVLSGFPPVTHDHPDEQAVGDFLSSNEVLRIQLKSSAGQQAQTVAVAAPPKKVKKAASGAIQDKPAVGFGAKIVGFKTGEATKNFSSKNPQKRSISEVNANEAPPKRKRRSSSAGKVSSEGDLAEHLISAVTGGTGTHNRAARKVFRNAVLHQYNSTQAVSRVNAIYSGNYTIRECGGVLLSSTSSSSTRPNVFTHIEVTYGKGSDSRGNHMDTVELLPKELLLGVLKVAVLGDSGDGQNADDSKEVLKPMNLSKCSPRIFWSMVHHYGSNLIENIRMVLKGVDDCTWLDDRKKLLSEKAMENLQQKEEQDAKRASKRGKKNSVEKTEPVVPPAVETVTKTASSAPKSKSPYTPEDPLAQEIIRYVQGAVLFEDIVPEEWRVPVATHLQADPTLAALALAALECSAKTRNALQALHDVPAALSLDQLESWIVSAQMQIFHAVWRLICGGGSERLRSALYQLRVRVPKHFRMWRTAPGGLLQGLTELDGGLIADLAYTWTDSAGVQCAENTALTAAKIAWMCQVAHAAQSVFAWIDDEQLHNMSPASADLADNTEANEEEEEEEGEEGWQFYAEAHIHLGKRARLLAENDYWEDGTVVGYLPPEPEEPMALWRVRIDSAKPTKGRLVARERDEDLEEHELDEALARLSN